jgi:hypothetical protein
MAEEDLILEEKITPSVSKPLWVDYSSPECGQMQGYLFRTLR